MTTDDQKIAVEDGAALEAIVKKIKLPSKCFIVFGPKEFRIQQISFDFDLQKSLDPTKTFKFCFVIILLNILSFKINDINVKGCQLPSFIIVFVSNSKLDDNIQF